MLKIHYANRVEVLAEGLADALAAPRDRPLASRTVIVPHPEMGRWLARFMARRHQICANIEFEMPSSALWRLAAAGRAGYPAENPLAPDLLALRLFAALLDDPPEAVARSLGDRDQDAIYRFSRRLAGHYHDYLVYRPEWVLDWERGDPDGWQPTLWRRVIKPGEPHWARLLEAISNDPDSLAPGEPLAVFASPGLAPHFVGLVDALARNREVTIHLWTPCREYWGDADSGRRGGASQAPGHGLLGALGGQLRDYFDGLQDFDAEVEEHFAEEAADDLLSGLRAGLLAYQERPVPPDIESSPSLALHGVHTRRREVEVCQDLLLEAFQRWPDLKPDEVQVLAPDIAPYVPLIEAVFGHAESSQKLPYRIFGPGAGTSPLLSAFDALLGLLTRPLSLGGLAELLRHDLIAGAFEIGENDRPIVLGWLEGAAPLDPADTGDGKFSWSRACRRLLLGSVFDDDCDFADARRAGVVAGGDGELLDGLISLLDTLDRLRLEAGSPRPLAGWMAWLGRLPDLLIREPRHGSGRGSRDALNQRQVLDQALGRIRRRAAVAGFDHPVSLAVAGDLLNDELNDLGTGSRGDPGGIGFASARMMRLVPSRVTVVLGLNDGEFPAAAGASDIDLMAQAPRRGDRSRRDDDRQLLLEWLGTCRDALYLTYLARHARDNSERQPSPLIDELDDALARCGRLDGHPASLRRVQHPAQPFSPRYGLGLMTFQGRFEPGTAGPGLLASVPVPAREVEPVVSLDDLIRFFQHPLRYFLNQRLGLTLEGDSRPVAETPPVDIDGLGLFRIRRTLVEAPMAEHGPWLSTDVAIPEGPVGQGVVAQVSREAASLGQQLAAITQGQPIGTLAFDCSAESLALAGKLHGVIPAGRIALRPAREKPVRLIGEWIAHLVFNHLLGHEGGGSTYLVSLEGTQRFKPVAKARILLEDLLALYRHYQDQPAWLLPRASSEYARLVPGGQDQAERRARAVLFTSRFPDIDDPWVRLALRDAMEPGAEFPELAERVWRPVWAALEDA